MGVIGRRVSSVLSTELEHDLAYVRQMLRELSPMAAPYDAVLANLIDMGVEQATDILTGARKAEPTILRKAVRGS